MTQSRQTSKFSSTLTDTLRLLDREIYHLVDTLEQQRSAELLIAIPASKFRLDGRPYADARAEHPGVIFSIDSRHGHLSYPCDTFTTWQDNLRAIALALEALRKVDRYGVTKRGEQYRGFMELEARAAAPFHDRDTALEWLRSFVDDDVHHLAPLGLIRRAFRKAHPDTGGDTHTFTLVKDAAAHLEGDPSRPHPAPSSFPTNPSPSYSNAKPPKPSTTSSATTVTNSTPYSSHTASPTPTSPDPTTAASPPPTRSERRSPKSTAPQLIQGRRNGERL